MRFFESLLVGLLAATAARSEVGYQIQTGHSSSSRELGQIPFPGVEQHHEYLYKPLPGTADTIVVNMPMGEKVIDSSGKELKTVEFRFLSDPGQNTLKLLAATYRESDKTSVMKFGIDTADVNKLEIEYAGSNFHIMLFDKTGNLRTELVGVDHDNNTANDIKPQSVTVKVNGKVIPKHVLTNAPTASTPEPTHSSQAPTNAPVVSTKQPTTQPTSGSNVPTIDPTSTHTPTASPVIFTPAHNSTQSPTLSDNDSNAGISTDVTIVIAVAGILVLGAITAANYKKVETAVKKLSEMRSSNNQSIPGSVDGISVINAVDDIEMTPQNRHSLH